MIDTPHYWFMDACGVACIVLALLFLAGCAAAPGTPCAGHFMCFN